MGIRALRERGVLAHDVRLWLKERFGEEEYKRISKRLSPGARAMFKRPLPEEWYPIELVRELYRAIDESLTAQHPEALVSLGRFMAQNGVKGFLAFMVRMVPMETIIGRLDPIWRRYHESGSIEVPFLKEEGTHKEGVLKIKDYDAGPAWCRIMEGYIEELIRFTGAKSVRVEKRTCIHESDTCCSWFASWEE